MRAKVAIGERYGRLIIIEDMGSIKSRGFMRTKVAAMCDCGIRYEGIYSDIKSGAINSCGCLRKEMAKEWGHERMYKHGLSSHPLMKIWSGMIERCHNPNCKHYSNYGGRGVKVCAEWRGDFKSFYDWAIENGWQNGLEIDKDTKGDGYLYSPSTCNIITKKENNRSKRSNVNITHEGVTKCLTDWAIEYNINANTLRFRLKRGWTVAQALNTPKITKYAERIKTH